MPAIEELAADAAANGDDEETLRVEAFTEVPCGRRHVVEQINFSTRLRRKRAGNIRDRVIPARDGRRGDETATVHDRARQRNGDCIPGSRFVLHLSDVTHD